MPDAITIKTKNNEILSGFHSLPKQAPEGQELEKTLVLMVHGFPGQSAGQNNLYGDLETILCEKGFHTFRFDFRGCGQSDGEQEDFCFKQADDDFKYVLSWAKSQGYKKIAYVSEGIGSALCILNMGLNVLCQVMMWPALNLPYLAKSYFKGESIDEEAQKAGYMLLDHNRVGLELIEDLKNVALGNRMRDVTMPVLILQGSDDAVFPMQQLDIARKYMSSKRIEITMFHDGGHGLPAENHRKMVYYHIEQFLQKYIS